MHLTLVYQLSLANRVPAYWRNVHLLSGVSPLLPQVLLIAGMYGWFWFTLHGLALLGEDRPLLPSRRELPPMMTMFSCEDAGTPIEDVARPLSKSYLRSLVIFFLITLAGFGLSVPGFGLLSLGERAFGILISLWLSLCIVLVLANALQMLETWIRLRQLLVFLDRITLRHTLNALKGLAWGSVWNMSGNVLEKRYRVISRQFESLRHLRNTIADWPPSDTEETEAKYSVLTRIDACLLQGRAFADWFVKLREGQPVEDVTALHAFQEELASTAGLVMKLLLVPAWQEETQSLIFGS